MSHQTAKLVEIDPEITETEAHSEDLSALEVELASMTADRDAADADLAVYVNHVNRLDQAVVVLFAAIVAASIAIPEGDISEIIAESLARSAIKANFAASRPARKAVIELARAE
jgi:hypothetical protein